MNNSRFENIKEVLGEINPSAILYDGYEDALIGVCERFESPSVACYDYDLCIKVLMREGMTEDEALEFFEYNTIGCGLGENTPYFIKQYE